MAARKDVERTNFTLKQYFNTDAPPQNDQLIIQELSDNSGWVAHVWRYYSHDSFRQTTVVASSQTLCKELALSLLRSSRKD